MKNILSPVAGNTVVLFLPLPIVVSLLLLLMLVSVIRANGAGKANRPFLALILASAVQSAFVGLRWGYHINELKFALPVMASLLPPLAYASFRSLMNDRSPNPVVTIAGVTTPPFAIIMMLLIYPLAIDFVLVALFVSYAIAIILLGRRGPDGLEEAPFASVTAAHRALYIAAIALCVSAMFDVLVLIDFAWSRGENAGVIISNGNLLGLLLIGLTAWVAGGSKQERPAKENTPVVMPVTATTEDHDIMARLERMMTTKELYRDENLNLTRLSRKLGLPSRQISNAINRATGGNVSQYVNQLRIARSCRLLEETDQTVTSIMLESGFQTKSNFNREFRRITGMSPLAWREREVWKLLAANRDGHPGKSDDHRALPHP